MGVIATTGGIAFTFGPPLGGLLTAFLSWHWIFLINVPIGIAAILLARTVIPKPETKPEKKPFDWKGTWLMFAAIASIILFLERGPVLGWTSVESIVTGTVFTISIIWFTIHSLKSDNPLLNVRIFKSWKFSAVATSYLLTCGVFAGVMYMVPYYMQTSLSLDAAVSGFLLMISAVITALVGIPVGAWSDRIGCRTPCILAAVFRISFCLILLFIIPQWGVIALLPALVCMGLAFGISGGPATTRIVQFAPKGEEGGPWRPRSPAGSWGRKRRLSSQAPRQDLPGKYRGGCRFCQRSLILAGGMSLDLPSTHGGITSHQSCRKLKIWKAEKAFSASDLLTKQDQTG
jgi:MFS family permease